MFTEPGICGVSYWEESRSFGFINCIFIFTISVLPLIIILQKWPAFMQISWKNSDLNFVFMQNFVQKIYLFRMNAQCKTGFVLIRKWCGISCKTTQLLRQENWLFRGNPNRKTTLKQYLKCISCCYKENMYTNIIK